MKVLVLCCALLAMVRVSSAVVNNVTYCNDNDTVCESFFNESAVTARRNHFYCGGFKAPRDDTEVKWSLAFQYPLLAYLDVARKRALFETVADYFGIPREDATDYICIASYDSYYVGTFDETVLVRIYNSQGPSFPIDTEQDFRTKYDADSVDYLNTKAINLTEQYLNLIDGDGLEVREAGGSTRGADPTFYAVLLNYEMGNVEDIYSFTVSDRGLQRANNPDPINYGLEAGDIVFLVIGIILLIMVVFAILMGYCIHPFFL